MISDHTILIRNNSASLSMLFCTVKDPEVSNDSCSSFGSSWGNLLWNSNWDILRNLSVFDVRLLWLSHWQGLMSLDLWVFGAHESCLENSLLLHDLSDAVQVNSLADSNPNTGPDKSEEAKDGNNSSAGILGLILIGLLIQPGCEILEAVLLGVTSVVLCSSWVLLGGFHAVELLLVLLFVLRHLMIEMVLLIGLSLVVLWHREFIIIFLLTIVISEDVVRGPVIIVVFDFEVLIGKG
jgi:hypothetical protein